MSSKSSFNPEYRAGTIDESLLLRIRNISKPYSVEIIPPEKAAETDDLALKRIINYFNNPSTLEKMSKEIPVSNGPVLLKPKVNIGKVFYGLELDDGAGMILAYDGFIGMMNDIFRHEYTDFNTFARNRQPVAIMFSETFKDADLMQSLDSLVKSYINHSSNGSVNGRSE